MNKDNFLKNVCKQIRFRWDHDIVSRELESHIDDSILDLMEEGNSKEDAEKLAIAQMGDPTEIGKQLDKEHKPLLGWAWLISKIIVILLIFPTLMFSLVLGKDIYNYIRPIKTNLIEETIRINETYELEAHTVTINKILKKDDLYCVTYHVNAKWNAYPVGVVDYLFRVTDENGNILDDNDKPKRFYNTFMGCNGLKWFEIPNDNIIYLSFTNGRIVKLNIKEYQYE